MHDNFEKYALKNEEIQTKKNAICVETNLIKLIINRI